MAKSSKVIEKVKKAARAAVQAKKSAPVKVAKTVKVKEKAAAVDKSMKPVNIVKAWIVKDSRSFAERSQWAAVKDWVQIVIWGPRKLNEEANRLAKKNGTSKSEFLRDMIVTGVRGHGGTVPAASLVMSKRGRKAASANGNGNGEPVKPAKSAKPASKPVRAAKTSKPILRTGKSKKTAPAPLPAPTTDGSSASFGSTDEAEAGE
jgi:hypothetical protein